MALGKLFKSLLLGSRDSDKAAIEPVSYKGFVIEAEPIAEGSNYRTAGYISGELDGETKRILFIRADQHGDQQSAIDHSLGKGRQIIDEQGTRLLKKTQL